MKRSLLFVCLGALLAWPVTLRSADDSADATLLAGERDVTKQRMLQIYDAIQEYRKDHKELPDYLSDLYPKYIGDTNTFLCPTALRLGKELPFPELVDPKLHSHYGYEFSARPIQAMFGYSGPMTMGAWKRMQMMVVGGVVPILRCFAYERVLNVGFDGKFYESALQWEDLCLDKVNARDLEPRHLRLALLKRLGAEAGGEALALEELQDAVSSNNRGVVSSGGPLSEEHRKWNEQVAQTSLAVAAQAGKFLAQFPQSTDCSHVRAIQERMLLKAAAAGSSDAARKLDELVADQLKGNVSEDERFNLRTLQVHAQEAQMNTRPEAEKREAFGRAVRSLIEEFPKRPEPYLMLLSTAQGASDAQVRAVADEVQKSPDAPEQAKERAQAMLRRLNLIGQPPDIQFTALDGREVELGKLKDKVVLVDFWATWCGPCVAEIPHVKAAYDKFHAQGFEIVGISFDQDRAALEKFVKTKELPWAQYFDGKEWQNKFGRRYGIESIPTMWLVDRKGNVVDINARQDLAGKVELLLAGKELATLTER